MPPVRWKILYVTILASLQIWTASDAQQLQDPISMTSDGWRPIVGTRRQPTYSSEPSHNKFQVEIVKSEGGASGSSTTPPDPGKPKDPSTSSVNNVNAGAVFSHNQGGKIPPHTKFTSPGYHTLPPKPQRVTLGTATHGRPTHFGFRKHPAPHYASSQKRKPPRTPVGAQSNRNEVFVHAPTSVNLPYLKQGLSNVKTRETQGLSLLGGNGNHFSINQPNAHIEVNRFPYPITNDNAFEHLKGHPVTYTFPKLKDEYTRNLVPPPPSRFLAEKEKLKSSKIPAKFKDNVATVSESVLEFHDLGLQHFGSRPSQVPDNSIQLSLPFVQNLQQFGHKEPNVEVTKEQLKVFHNNVPSRFQQNAPEYVDYDFHSVASHLQQPKLQTYEVTEGKWVDSPNPYAFTFSQNSKQPSGPARPQLIPEPLVELNLPPFLPTPYRPPGAAPTSATQTEASTIFSQVSTKMNKYKAEVLTANPLFFDLKEVSTHYPILGPPEFSPESETDTPQVVNEIATTLKPKKRRRPQPRRTTTTPATITTTSEEPTTTYDYRKNQNSFESSYSEETERPLRRQRPRPNRIRTGTTGSGSYEGEARPQRYRTTTPSTEVEEVEEKRVRGRHRYRQRVPAEIKENNDLKPSLYRKRIRTTTEMPVNHKVSEENESFMSKDAQGDFESKFLHNLEEETTVPAPMEVRHHVGSQHQAESSVRYDTKPRDDEHEGVMIEEVIGTEDSREAERYATTEEPMDINGNEIDYPTPTVALEHDQKEHIQTTLATTTPTTTTTTEAQTTTKPARTRGRPIKYHSSNRPRFSVKDYRQRLNQYTSTTPSTTTDFVKTTSEVSRFRFPNRFRTRPSLATTPSYQEEEQITELVLRRKFRPKEPRHSSHSTTTTTETVADDDLKPVKLKPTRMKSNLFPIRRKALVSTRKNLNKASSDTEETTTTTEPTTATAKAEEEHLPVETSSEFPLEQLNVAETTTNAVLPSPEEVNEDDYSQRVSDLTSSFRHEYETPGLFKSVSPNSRRVPNYFTISTEDPILPIEAFFPNIKEQ